MRFVKVNVEQMIGWKEGIIKVDKAFLTVPAVFNYERGKEEPFGTYQLGFLMFDKNSEGDLCGKVWYRRDTREALYHISKVDFPEANSSHETLFYKVKGYIYLPVELFETKELKERTLNHIHSVFYSNQLDTIIPKGYLKKEVIVEDVKSWLETGYEIYEIEAEEHTVSCIKKETKEAKEIEKYEEKAKIDFPVIEFEDEEDLIEDGEEVVVNESTKKFIKPEFLKIVKKIVILDTDDLESREEYNLALINKDYYFVNDSDGIMIYREDGKLTGDGGYVAEEALLDEMKEYHERDGKGYEYASEDFKENVRLSAEAGQFEDEAE